MKLEILVGILGVGILAPASVLFTALDWFET